MEDFILPVSGVWKRQGFRHGGLRALHLQEREEPVLARPSARQHARGHDSTTVGFEAVGRPSRLPALISEPQGQAGRVREEGPGGGIGRAGSGKGFEANKPYSFPLFLNPVRRLFRPGGILFFAQQQLARTFIFL